MTSTPKPSSKNNLNRLSDRIDSVQEKFRKLSKTASLKQLSQQFAEVLGEMFNDKTIDISHRPAGSAVWEDMVTRSIDGLKKFHDHYAGQQSAVSDLLEADGCFVIVHKLADESHIGLVLSDKKKSGRFSEVDVLSLRLMVTMFDNTYKDVLHRRSEKGLVFSLNHRILQLNSLIDTGIEVSTLKENTSPHRLALMRAASLTNASTGVVRVKHGKEVLEKYAFPEGSKLAHPAAPENKIKSGFTFQHETYTFELFNKESRSGTVAFEDTDQLLLDALARQVHASLENRYLLQQALEKQRIEQEMTVAASIQNKIIPVSLPAILGYDVAGKNIPSKSVGGDYYDCIPLPDGRYALIVADVTGKGVPAALLVSSLHAYLSAYLELSNTLPELLGKLNKALYNTTTDDKFVTAFFAILSPETGEIEYSSAGHNPAYLLRSNGKVEEINLGGPPLGIINMDFPYLNGRLTVEKGECFLLYTDGVTEAMNEKGDLYERNFSLSDFLIRHKSDKAEVFIAEVIADVRKFTGSAPQTDDITVLYLRRNE